MKEGLFDIGKTEEEDNSVPAKMARKLANTLHSKGHRTKVDLNSWIKELQGIEAVHGTNELQWVVEVHCSALANSKKHLKVFSARTLARRFQEMRKFYSGEQKINLSPEQDFILQTLQIGSCNWSHEHVSKLPALVKMTHENYSNSWRKFQALDHKVKKLTTSILERTYKGGISLGEADLLLKWYVYARKAFEISNPRQFTHYWCRRVQNYLNGFPDWEGDLLRFVWEIDQPDFVKLMNERIKKHTFSSKVHWKMFVSEFLG